MFTRRTFRIPDRQHLWDSSSDEDEEQHQQQSNIELIDLTDSPRPVMCNTVSTTAAAITTTVTKDWPSYVPRTLQLNSPRYSILPAFPTSFYNDQSPALLLANVSSMFCNQDSSNFCL
jgi:hypothetical protein